MLSSRSVRGALFICLFASVLPGQQDRIRGPIDGRSSVVVRGSVPAQTRSLLDEGAVPGDFPLGNVTLVLRPSAEQQSALEQLLREQQDSSSANYHQWLTPETYAGRFGASAADIAKLTDWLTSEGFIVKLTARGRDFISFSGTASQAQHRRSTHSGRRSIGTGQARRRTLPMPAMFPCRRRSSP
jgi:hypothetical protein